MFENYIIKGIGGFYYVKTKDAVLECRAKGIFRKRNISPLAGDFVTLEKEAGTNVIAEISERKNVFVRPPIANVDNFFIVVSTVEPVPSTLVIDKLIAIAVDKNAEPIILITKTDIESGDELLSCYQNSGIKAFIVNAQTGDGLSDVKALLENKISVFCGNSGVGKSTLLSAILPDAIIETSEISKKLGRGKHTTREVTLYEINGGLVADTPGFASLEMDKANFIPKENLEYCFPEFTKYFGKCKFTGCSHTGEKGCAVKEALENDEIEKSRFFNYCTLYEEAKQVKDWQR